MGINSLWLGWGLVGLGLVGGGLVCVGWMQLIIYCLQLAWINFIFFRRQHTRANTFHDRSSFSLIVKISQPVSCNISGTWYEVLLRVLPLVSSTATTKKQLVLKDKHSDWASQRVIQAIHVKCRPRRVFVHVHNAQLGTQLAQKGTKPSRIKCSNCQSSRTY